jgi:hypothetical protein
MVAAKHTVLLPLVHAVRWMRGVENTNALISPAALPKFTLRITALDGENSDPANGRHFADATRSTLSWRVCVRLSPAVCGITAIAVSCTAERPKFQTGLPIRPSHTTTDRSRSSGRSATLKSSSTNTNIGMSPSSLTRPVAFEPEPSK